MRNNPIIYVADCYEEDCPGKMKEVRRSNRGKFVEVTLRCEKCKAEDTVEIERGTLGT